MTISSQKTPSTRRWLLIGGAAIVAILIGVIAAGAIAASRASSGAAPRPTSTSTAEPVQRPTPPETAKVAASFAGWSTTPGAEPRVLAEGGKGHDGAVNLFLARSEVEQADLSQVIDVTPSTEYSITAAHRGESTEGASISVAMGSSVPFELTNAAEDSGWKETTWTYTTGPDEEELTVSIHSPSTGNGSRLDGLVVHTSTDETNLVINGSFEDYSAPASITNETLFMQTGAAYVGLAARVSEFNWSVKDSSGTEIDSGTTQPHGGLGLVPLGELAQGFYTADLASSEPGLPRDSFAFLVLDEPVPAIRDDRFGVGAHLERRYYDGSEKPAESIGFTHARTDTLWSLIEVDQGSYTFDPLLGASFDAFESRGVGILPISIYGNKYYDEGKTASSPAGIEGYANFTAAIQAHYNPDSIEIYNEFNNEHFNKGACGRTAECYMQLLAPTVEKLRAANPETKIVGPANAHKDDAFLTALYQAGGLQYLDAISFHPYDYDYGDNKGAEFLVDSLKQAEDRIKEYNDGQTKPIWITEMGWSSTLVEDDQQQADYLVRSEVISLASGVERFFWYDLVNDHLDPRDHQGSYGLVRQKTEALPTFEPKASSAAQAILIRKIGGKEFNMRDELNQTSYSYAFGTGEGTTRVAWSTSPVTVSYATKAPVTVTTQYGEVSVLKPVDGVITIDLGEQTVYLDGVLGEATIVG